MYEELWHLVLNNRILLGSIIFVIVLLVLLMIYWVYAEILMYLRAKKQAIEKVRNKMDGIEMGLKTHHKGHMDRRRSSDGGLQQIKTINFKNLDKAGEKTIKYSKITIIKEEPDQVE